MKKYTYLLLLALAMPLVLASCLSDEETETDDYCYISGFTLGSMKRTLFTISTDGVDSAYTTTFAGSLFPMTIDQRALTIENKDSLPLRTVVNKVLTTISYEGGLIWRTTNPTDEDTLWTTYSSSDSLDFTEPLDFACIATNGDSYRTYTVTLNVHKQKADSTIWNNLGEADALEGMGARRAICIDGQIRVLGEDGSGSLACAQHPMGTSGDWVTLQTSGTYGADVNTLQQQGSSFYLSTTGGEVLKSSDAVDWTSAGVPAEEGLQLVAASPSRLYALLDGKLMSSDGGPWQEESLDDDSQYLPSRQVYSFSYLLPDGQNRLMLVGARDNEEDLTCMVWAKTWDETSEEPASTWMFYVPNGTDKRRCPVMEDLNVVAYDDGFLAFGGASRDGRYAAMDSVLYSRDHGITWKPYDDYDMDVDPLIQEAAQNAQYICSTVDDDQFLWLFVDKEVWRGRINRLGFLRQDPN